MKKEVYIINALGKYYVQTVVDNMNDEFYSATSKKNAQAFIDQVFLNNGYVQTETHILFQKRG